MTALQKSLDPWRKERRCSDYIRAILIIITLKEPQNATATRSFAILSIGVIDEIITDVWLHSGCMLQGRTLATYI